MRNWKQDKQNKTKQNRKAKQEGKEVEAKVPAKDGLMERAHGDADQHKSIDRMRRQASKHTTKEQHTWLINIGKYPIAKCKKNKFSIDLCGH